MSEPSKKQSFLHGTALLALAAGIVKVIGALYKIPLNAIIGERGFAYFNTAYEIYSVLLTVSIAGLPVAMSRMISEATALGHYNQVRRIYKTSRALFFSLGLAGTLLMTLFCKQLANFQEQPDAWAAIGALGPCLLLICIMGTYRGFFQGQSNMTPTAISQVLEAVCKLIVGMAAALLLLKWTGSIPYAAAGAILGVTASCVLSSIYLSGRFRKAQRAMPVTNEPVTSYKKTLRSLLAIAVPITIGSAGLSVLTALETRVFMGQLLSHGNAQADVETMKGVYDMTKTIFNMPIAFISPIAISIIPAITSTLALGQHGATRSTEESSIRVTGLICAPCAVGLMVLARPITGLLGRYTGANLELATLLMTILGGCILLYALIQVTNAMMQAHGHANLPVINMLIGGALKLGAVYMLTGDPQIGIVGAPVGALIGYLIIVTLNLVTMRRCISHPPAIVRNLFRAVMSALIMGAAVFATWFALTHVLGESASHLVLCVIPIGVGVLVYAFCAIKLRAITREDCLLLPKGEKIANLLHL